MAASGVQYHCRSVEFRLLTRLRAREILYRTRLDAWTAGRLLDIYNAVAAPVTDAPARKNYVRALDEQRRALARLFEPLAERTPEQGPAPTDAGMAAYLDALGGVGPFRSLDELLAAVAGLNQTVEELRGDHA